MSYQFSPSRSRGSDGSVSNPKGDQCNNCKGYEHHKSQCLSKFIGLTEKKLVEEDELEKVYEPTKVIVLEAKANEAKERAAKGITSLIHPMFAI